MSQCECHDQPILAACLSCQAFLCKECLMSHDLNDQLAYFSDYIRDNYDSISKVGEGSLTKVYKARSLSTQKFFAVKMIKDFDSKPSEAQSEVLQQAYLNQQMSHRSIIRHEQTIRSNGNLYIVQEMGESAISQKFIQSFKKRKMALNLIVQLLEGVVYLHDEVKQTHFMLKPSNVLLVKEESGEERVKICDAGIVKNINFITITSQSNINGLTKYAYFPPEFFKQEEGKGSKAIDIWSLGCLIHQILTNIHPFLNRDVRSLEDLKSNIMEGKYTLAKGVQGTLFANIIHSCLQPQPSQRASAEELLTAFYRIQAIYDKYPKEADGDKALNEITKKFLENRDGSLEDLGQLFPGTEKQKSWGKEFESENEGKKGNNYLRIMFQTSSPSKSSNIFSGSEDEFDTKKSDYKDEPTPKFKKQEQMHYKVKDKQNMDKYEDDKPTKPGDKVPSLQLSRANQIMKQEQQQIQSQKATRREKEEDSDESNYQESSMMERSEQSTIIESDSKALINKRQPQVIKVKKYSGQKKEEEKKGSTQTSTTKSIYQNYYDIGKKESSSIMNRKDSSDSQAPLGSHYSSIREQTHDKFAEPETMNMTYDTQNQTFKEIYSHLDSKPNAMSKFSQTQKINHQSNRKSNDFEGKKQEQHPPPLQSERGRTSETQQPLPPFTPQTRDQKMAQFRQQPAKSNLEYVYQHASTDKQNQYMMSKNMRMSFEKKENRVRQFTSPSQRKLFQPARTQVAMSIKNLEIETEMQIENAHSGMLWQMKKLTHDTYATCSNEKVIKMWNSKMKDPYDQIYLDQPLNSIAPALMEKGQFQCIAAGTFSGGVALISLPKQKMVKFLDRQHKSYVSQTICLSYGKGQYFATISSESIKIWQIQDESFSMAMQIDLEFTNEGDYKWWDLCEISAREFLDHSKETLLACCSSKDFQTRIYSVNFITGTHLHLNTFNQKFHPRAIQQITHYPSADKLLIVTVGMVDDKNSFDGCIEIFNVIHGQSVALYTDNLRLCSVACLKTDIDMIEKKDVEHLFVGTSDRKVVEYVYKDCEVTKMRDFDTIHKKSIFGMLVLNNKSILTGSLDSKIMVHSIVN